MWFRIDSQSGVPIYRQIAAQVEQAVLAGVLRAGDRLPAVRDLALELAVNPNTVVKAYTELQHAGVIEQPRGRGTFVRGAPRLEDDERIRRLQAAAANFVAEARRLGYAAPDIWPAVESALAAAGVPFVPERGSTPAEGAALANGVARQSGTPDRATADGPAELDAGEDAGRVGD